MTDSTTSSLKKEFVEDVAASIEDEPFGSVKEFIRHLVIREMESADTISKTEARQVGRKLRELGYME